MKSTHYAPQADPKTFFQHLIRNCPHLTTTLKNSGGYLGQMLHYFNEFGEGYLGQMLHYFNEFGEGYLGQMLHYFNEFGEGYLGQMLHCSNEFGDGYLGQMLHYFNEFGDGYLGQMLHYFNEFGDGYLGQMLHYFNEFGGYLGQMCIWNCRAVMWWSSVSFPDTVVLKTACCFHTEERRLCKVGVFKNGGALRLRYSGKNRLI